MRAIVTGSSRGLGLAISKKFIELGFDVVVTSRNEKSLQALMEELKLINSKPRILGFIVDFEDGVSVNKFLDNIISKWDKVDILVNNVGLFMEDSADENIENTLIKSLNINLLSAVRMTNKISDLMKKNKNGFIFNIISIAAINLRDEAASYSISKMALKGYSDLLRKSLRKFGIRVVSIYPGQMNTSSWDESNADRLSMIQTSDITSSIVNVLNFSANATIEEIVINKVSDN